MIFKETQVTKINIIENADLTNKHFLRFPIVAKKMIEINDFSDLLQISQLVGAQDSVVWLGHGSNVFFAEDFFSGCVIKMNLLGHVIMKEWDDCLLVKVNAGEEWDGWVSHCTERGWQGLELLSSIPGTVGAAPVQNIGAYGAQVSDVIEGCDVFDRSNGSCFTLSKHDCAFGYRDSIFKRNSDWLIHAVTFKLMKNVTPRVNHPEIVQRLHKDGKAASVKNVRQVVQLIRQQKLPDPTVFPNAGSFFKNPVISSSQLCQLRQLFPKIPAFVLRNGLAKLSAAWLIESVGYKGHCKPHVSVSSKHALVLGHHGAGHAKELLALSEEIMLAVQNKFGVLLEREVCAY